MATKCEKSKLLTTTNNVVKLVPNAIEQKNKSITLMQEMTGLLISSIIYNRKLVPEEHFESRRMEQEKVHILKCNSNNPIALKVVELTHSIYEAIKLEYLREVMIIIENEKEVVETHTLSFEYSGDYFSIQIELSRNENKKMSQKKLGCELVAKQIKAVLKSLLIALSIEIPNLEKPSLHFRLRFYENVTPPDYQPPCFEPETAETKKISLQTQSLNSGTISTPFHTFKVKSKFMQAITGQQRSISPLEPKDKIITCNLAETVSEKKKTKKGENILDQPQKAVKSPEVLTETNTNDSNTVLYNTQTKDTLSLDVPSFDENNIQSEKKDQNNKSTDQTQNVTFRCPCGINKPILPHYLLCDNCNFAQHTACFKIAEESKAPVMHICDLCASDTLVSTVPEMRTMNVEEKRNDCLIRLTMLLFGTDTSAINPEKLANILNIDQKSAETIIDALMDMFIIQKKHNKFILNKREYRNAIEELFNKPNPDDFKKEKKSAWSYEPKAKKIKK